MDVRYITINEEDLYDLPIIDGQIIALADTPRWYYDMNDIRYNVSSTIYCSMLPPEDEALNGVIYILNQSLDDSSGEDPEGRLDGAYLFIDGQYVRVSQLYNPAASDELGLVKIGDNIEVTPGGVISVSPSRIREIAGIASTMSAGLVRVGSGLEVTPSGILSVPTDAIAREIMDEIKSDPTVFPVASTSSVGVVRIGDNINVSSGVISVSSNNISDALGYIPAVGTTVSVGSDSHPGYWNNGIPSATGYYLDVWTVGNGKGSSYSTCEGYMTTASGQTAHSEGYKTMASGVYSHAEGYQSIASAPAAHAQGYDTLAAGQYSSAGGYMSTASGDHSIAEGYRARATGTNSVAFGYYAYAAGSTAVCIGSNVYASTAGNVVVGNNSTATRVGQTVIGSRGITIDDYNNQTFMSEYYDLGASAAAAKLSTFVYSDNLLEYNDMRIASQNKPYPLTGINDDYLVYTRTKSYQIPKPGDTKNRYFKQVSTYSYTYPEYSEQVTISDTQTEYKHAVKYPYIVNSGVLLNQYGNNADFPWTPIMTRLLTYEDPTTAEVKFASTIISGLLATDIQPVIYCESHGPSDVKIVTLPDTYGSIVIFRSSYDKTANKGKTNELNEWGTTYFHLYYMMPCDGKKSGPAAASNKTQYGCKEILLGYGAVSGTKANYLKFLPLNSEVLDTSEAWHSEIGQFAFWCSTADTHKADGNGMSACVSAAIYSLPARPAAFEDMMQIKYQKP